MQKQIGGIRRVAENKKEYLDLLLLAEEQEKHAEAVSVFDG